MTKQEITLKGIDGQVDELVLTTSGESIDGNLENCARLLFPQEGETIPRLRFKGFKGEWVTTRLCQISKKVITKNLDLKYKITLTNSAEQGIVNQLDYFDHDVSNEDNISGYYVVENDDFVYNPRISTSAPVGPINRNQLGYTGVMSPLYYVFRIIDEKIDIDYLSYFFKTTLWHKFMYDNGNSGARFDRFSISDEVFGQMPIIHPKEIAEQKLIASLFCRLDAQMKLHQQQYERLKQLKSACLDSMFPKHSESTPPIRFSGYEGEWLSAKLSDYATRITRKNSNMESNLPLTISASEGLIEQTAFFNNVVASTNMSGYYLLRKGEFAYNKSYSNGYPFGAVKKLEKYEQGALSPLYIVFSIAESVNDDYIVYYFETSNWHREVAKRAAEGARNHGLLNIGADDFLDITIAVPKDKREQEQLAAFFRSLDSQIATFQQKLERLKQMKSACLRSMFPSSGGGILPLIRFNGYEGEWITMKMSQIINVNSGMDYKRLNPGTIPVYGTGGYMLSVDKSISDVDAIGIGRKGTIDNPMFLRAPFWTIDTLFYMTLKKEFDLDFVFALCQTINWRSLDESTGVPSLSKKNIENVEVSVPRDIEEQRRIAAFFSSIDKKISIHTQQIEKLKQLKSACLDKMIA